MIWGSEIMSEIEKYLNDNDTTSKIVVAIDIEGYVSFVNTKACKVLGYPKEEVIGKSWFNNFLPENNRKEVITVFKKLMRNDIEFTEHFENTILTSAEEERLIAWHNKLLKDDEENNIGTLSSGKDITEL